MKRARRTGVILLVVIALLALFAMVGLGFYYFSQAKSVAARTYRESEEKFRIPPEVLLTQFLAQLIWDVDDGEAGCVSALRGHSLARSMYGWNDGGQNNVPFNGMGRWHTGAGTYNNPWNTDDFSLVNYQWHQGDGFVRDPERLGPTLPGTRADPSAARGPYTGGANAPYTYPDLNNMFLAAVRADGTVLTPSFHRDWAGFGPLDPGNPNWSDLPANPHLKYRILRPHPQVHAGFPAPGDAGGDVKNLSGGPGGNDSIWIDIGAPVHVLPDGRKIKPLFAPLIVDLDSRVNLNVHGNVRGAGNSHASNQGHGPWEVNVGKVMTAGGGSEWTRLLLGNGTLTGRYGPDQLPGSGGDSPAQVLPHSYAQVDFDGCREAAGYVPTGVLTLPDGTNPLQSFPGFLNGYGNRNGGAANTERHDHPSLYTVFQPAGDDRYLPLGDLKALWSGGSAEAANSLVGRLCPANMADARIRRLVTLLSFDVDRPGCGPWLYDVNGAANDYAVGAATDLPPSGSAQGSPSLTLRSNPLPTHTDFTNDWRGALAEALGRIDINRPLAAYPTAARFDDGGAVQAAYQVAQQERQQLANDIYRMLLRVTGVKPPNDGANPTDAELMPRRWLAQLAVNMVDFRDEDDIATPFNFYNTADGLAAGDIGNVSNFNAELPRYWVIGSEMPRVVLNEMMAEYVEPGAAGNFDVRVWVELFNPLPGPPHPPTVQSSSTAAVPFYVAAAGLLPGYSPYQLVIANTNAGADGPLLPRPLNNDNVLGTPETIRAQTNDADFTGQARTVGDPALTANKELAPQNFFLIGPPGQDARNTIADPRVPGTTPWLETNNLSFQVAFTPPNTWNPNDRPAGVTVLLRRLANPHLPFDTNPLSLTYNPFVTVDYLDGLPLHDASNPATVYASRGKLQPYAAERTAQIADQVPGAPSNTRHSLGLQNDPVPAAGRHDWLVHLDRTLISALELLHVSGYKPHELTHRFLSGGVVGNHRAPWYADGNRLYRAFEFLQTRSPLAGTTPGGRVPGKINLNTIWDRETFEALCSRDPANGFTDADVVAVWNQLLALRTPGGNPGANDRPFRGMAVPIVSGGDAQYPAGMGIEDTFLRSFSGGPARLFDVPGAQHPYMQTELMTKIFANTTTRSHVFAVYLTVGFFDVVDDTTRPVRLGAESGAPDRVIRHRMFAIVDRSALTLVPTVPADATSNTAISQPGVATVTPVIMPGGIQAGTILIVGTGSNREAVVATAADATSFTARFQKTHAAPFGIWIGQPGNPGPRPNFQLNDNAAVLPYWSILE